MYVILTDHPGVYRTEFDDDVVPCESYEYRVGTQLVRVFTIAQVSDVPRIRLVGQDGVINDLPGKFLSKHEQLDAARAEVMALHAPNQIDARIIRIARCAVV